MLYVMSRGAGWGREVGGRMLRNVAPRATCYKSRCGQSEEAMKRQNKKIKQDGQVIYYYDYYSYYYY